MDHELRDADRAGDPLPSLRARLRSGALAREQVELAARLGHGGAQALFPQAEAIDWADLRARQQAIEAAAAWVGEDLAARVAADWAERSLATWEARHPGDQRPREAVIAARAWAHSPSPARLEAAAQRGFAADEAAMDGMSAAWDAGQRAPPLGPDASYEDKVAGAAADPAQSEAVAAAFAAHAARWSAATDAQRWAETSSAAFCAATAAAAAATNAEDPAAERRWQRLRLARYLLLDAAATQDGLAAQD